MGGQSLLPPPSLPPLLLPLLLLPSLLRPSPLVLLLPLPARLGNAAANRVRMSSTRRYIWGMGSDTSYL